MNKSYYSIQCCHTDIYNHRGKRFINSQADLIIGQTEYCDLRLPNMSPYEDTELAAIRKSITTGGWVLIRLSPFIEHGIMVNGTTIDCIYPLQDGDILSFNGQQQELKFNIYSNEKYDYRGIVTIESQISSRLILIVLFLPIVLFICSFGFWYKYIDHSHLTDQEIQDISSSIYQLRIDSIRYVSISGSDTTILGSCKTDIAETAFFTTDSLLVTARHSIEPWLNIQENQFLKDTSKIEPIYARWALKAETYNQTNDYDSCQQVISYCSLYRHDTIPILVYCCTSADFKINRSRDLIVELGDLNQQYYLRSISSRPRRTDMMLGDIAYTHINSGMSGRPKGSIRLATINDLILLNQSARPSLTIFGFPQSENIGRRKVEIIEASLTRSFINQSSQKADSPLCIDRKVSKGFSGGPVVFRHKGDCYAVGVVSVTDKLNTDRTYSIPVTEIQNNKDE